MYIKNRNNQPTASGLFRMVSDNKKGRARLPFLQNQETAFLRPERLVQSARPASPVPLRQRLRELFRRNGSGSEYRKNEQGRTGPLSPFTNIPAFNERNKIIQMDFDGHRIPLCRNRQCFWKTCLPSSSRIHISFQPGPSCFQGRIIRITPVPSLIKSGTVRHIVRSPLSDTLDQIGIGDIQTSETNGIRQSAPDSFFGFFRCTDLCRKKPPGSSF